MRFLKFLVAIVMVAGVAAPVFAADSIAKLTLGDDQFIELHYLLQVQAYSLQKEGATATLWFTTIFMHHNYLMMCWKV